LANIFKKIKTIDAVGDAPRTAKPSAPSQQEPARLGLKPVLKADTDDLIDATDFKDPFGHDGENDLAIPDIKIQTDRNDPEKTIEQSPSEKREKPADSPVNDEAETELPALENDKLDPLPETKALNEDEAYNNILPSQSESHENEVSDSPAEAPKFLVKSIDIPKAPLITAALTVSDEKKLHIHPIHETASPANEPHGDTAPAPKTETMLSPQQQNKPADDLPSFISKADQPRLDMPDYQAPKWPYRVIAGLTCLWLIGSAAAAYGYFELGLTPLTAKPIHALGFIGIVFVPACLLILCALLLKRLNIFSQVSQEMAYLNQKLLLPSDHAAQSTTRLADEINRQMDRVEQRADQAFHRLTKVQSAFADQIESVSHTLSTSVQDQTALDNQLRASKTAWAGSIKDTDQTISELSQTLEHVFDSFQTRVTATQNNMAQLSEQLSAQINHMNASLSGQSETAHSNIQPLIERAEQLNAKLKEQISLQETRLSSLKSEATDSLKTLDTLLEAQTEKLNKLTAQQETLASGQNALSAARKDEDSDTQDRLFRHISQIDALNDRTDVLISKIDTATARLTAAVKTVKPAPEKTESGTMGLRGSLKDEQLSLLPGLGEAKDMLPSLLTPAEDDDMMILSYDDIDSGNINADVNQHPQAEIPQRLSIQRVFGGHNPAPKANWFKRFGRRATDPVMPQNPVGPISPPPPTDISVEPSLLDLQIDNATLQEKLIRLQLSPDALIDSGSVLAAVQHRLKDGPFAMSRYMATHLGGAIDYLRDQLPHDPVLRRQVYDMASGFPLRERLDEKDEDGLIDIFETEAGREYLLCDAALNG